MILAIVVGLSVLALMMVSLYLSGKFHMGAKMEMQCIAFEDQNLFLEVQSELEKAGIRYSHLLRSPSQTAFNSIAIGKKTPKELWIPRDDADKARELLASKYRVEVTPYAMIIHGKSH
jgi:hypothetical protein